MHLIFTKNLSFIVRLLNVIANKIDGIILKIYKIVIIAFLVFNQTKKMKFFKNLFLMANISLNIVF